MRDTALLQAVAVEAARAGAAELTARFTLTRQVTRKGENDLVTDADAASEARIVEVLRRHFPEDAILAEEGGASGAGPWRWLVDPLDGTANYAQGIPHFCVSVAVEGPEGLQAGVVLDPVRQELFQAMRGKGATLRGRPLSVSRRALLSEAVIGAGLPSDLASRPEGPLPRLNRMALASSGLRRMGAAALDLAYVAAGRFDVFFEEGLKAWDIAAGALLVEEAGGKVTHLHGGPLDLTQGDVLATNRLLHEAALASLQNM